NNSTTLNWYTKAPIEGEVDVEQFLTEFADYIARLDKSCETDSEFVDKVYDFLKSRIELQVVPPDARLPTTSLWSHLKLTSALA
ncbi:MAG: hypothetical protein QME12_09235, partial [Nanoarchaeota archaeon]|nr:hypothetical protein [Nanoarchaeota archaeon]